MIINQEYLHTLHKIIKLFEKRTIYSELENDIRNIIVEEFGHSSDHIHDNIDSSGVFCVLKLLAAYGINKQQHTSLLSFEKELVTILSDKYKKKIQAFKTRLVQRNKNLDIPIRRLYNMYQVTLNKYIPSPKDYIDFFKIFTSDVSLDDDLVPIKQLNTAYKDVTNSMQEVEKEIHNDEQKKKFLEKFLSKKDAFVMKGLYEYYQRELLNQGNGNGFGISQSRDLLEHQKQLDKDMHAKKLQMGWVAVKKSCGVMYKKDGQLYAHYPQTSSLSFGGEDPFQTLLNDLLKEPFMKLHEAYIVFEELLLKYKHTNLKTQIDKQLAHIHTREFILKSKTNRVNKIADLKKCVKDNIVMEVTDEKIEGVKNDIEAKYMDKLNKLTKPETPPGFGQINNIL